MNSTGALLMVPVHRCCNEQQRRGAGKQCDKNKQVSKPHTHVLHSSHTLCGTHKSHDEQEQIRQWVISTGALLLAPVHKCCEAQQGNVRAVDKIREISKGAVLTPLFNPYSFYPACPWPAAGL
jgi:hypothetical protein